MNLIKNIKSFNEISIDLTLKTLIICDIDDTLLTFDKDYNYFFNLTKNKRLYNYDIFIHKDATYNYNLYLTTSTPKHTDIEGFKNLSNNQNVKIIFLTSRNYKTKFTTIKQFNDIGLNYFNYDVYYTNNYVGKGEYIKKYISLVDYEKIIFIDDMNDQLINVKLLFPFIECYKFII